MKPTESAAPVSRPRGFAALAGMTPGLPVAVVVCAAVAARHRASSGTVRDGPRALPRRHGGLVARRPHRHHRRPSGRARPRPLVGRHRLRRRPHPRRPAALRLGARRPGQPGRRRPGRRRPPAPLAAGRCCTAPWTSSASARPRSSSPRSATCRPSRQPWPPLDWGIDAVPEVVLAAAAYLVVTRLLLWYALAPQGGGLPTVARTALLRQGLVAVALLGIAPLICVVAVALPRAAAAVRRTADRPGLHALDRPGPRRGAAARPADRAAQPAVAAGADLDRPGGRRGQRRPFRSRPDRPRPLPLRQ